ncbi:hypothetical protein B0G82_5460 [Paraburkholderia sp. BL17N1]|nr:hypothetical protein B0G73_108161 [Paraburkholderia sp. BL25I1N1]RKR37388.1 hypothetical protein B0G82_5460 [Paraburkholderia sp. BL17N1]
MLSAERFDARLTAIARWWRRCKLAPPCAGYFCLRPLSASNDLRAASGAQPQSAVTTPEIGAAARMASLCAFAQLAERFCAPRQVRSSRALVTTLTLENAIAAPASIGFNQPKAASGIPIRL